MNRSIVVGHTCYKDEKMKQNQRVENSESLNSGNGTIPLTR